MTRAELRAKILFLAGEDSSTDFVTEDELNSIIKDGMKDLSQKIMLVQGKKVQAVADGTEEYTVDTDGIVSVKKAFYGTEENKNRLRKIYRHQISYIDFEGTPRFFWINRSAGKVGLYPIPDTDVSDALVVYYVGYLPTLSDDNAEPDCALFLHIYFAFYGTWQLKLRDDDYQGAAYYEEKMEDLISEAITEYGYEGFDIDEIRYKKDSGFPVPFTEPWFWR